MPSDFTPPQEELQRVSGEIAVLRRDFQTALAALGRIEKRLRAAFPNYPSKKPASERVSAADRPASTKSREQLLADFDSLVAATRERGDSGFHWSLGRLPDQEILAMAYELGVASPKKTSVKKARDGIRKRIQESLLLTFEHKKGA
jgi:hypothetical protein